MTKKIAVVFEGYSHQRYGVFNAVVNRVKYLRAVSGFHIDIFMIQVYDSWLTRRFRESEPVEKGADYIEADGERIKIWWVSRSFVDGVIHHTLDKEPVCLFQKFNLLARELKGYHMVSAHDMLPAQLAWSASKQFRIPFFVTWHGTSIHTTPLTDPMVKRITLNLINQASCNFFVTERLAAYAVNFFDTGIKYQVLHNGASDAFVRLPDDVRSQLRKRLGVEGKKVITFAARFEQEKNAMLLPRIFQAIKAKHHGGLQFWAFGDGTLRPSVEKAMKSQGIDCTFWGNQPPTAMPEFLNCTDVLVLPSRLEAMPLITIEALSCGANAVGTDVMGIASVVGEENVVDINRADFVEAFSSRVALMLAEHVEQHLPADCSWEATAKKELEIYHHYL
ncbi:MAG: glycosyltransferase [Bacteroidales bacterium]|nr:glycosyltransferase [Bacteroidales bacterium]